MSTQQLTRSHAFAALCIWEWMAENEGNNAKLDNLRNAVGTYALRELAISMAPAVDSAWGKLPEYFRLQLLPFDWGFVPLICKTIEWADLFDTATDLKPFTLNSATIEAIYKPSDGKRLEVMACMMFRDINGDETHTDDVSKAAYFTAFVNERTEGGDLIDNVAEIDTPIDQPALARKRANELAAKYGLDHVEFY